jgi:hypothetical protein
VLDMCKVCISVRCNGGGVECGECVRCTICSVLDMLQNHTRLCGIRKKLR